MTSGMHPTTQSSPASSSVRCQFLGSLTSPRGRDILSQLCLQIAQQSKLRHHFVERKEMDKMARQFFPKSTNNNHSSEPMDYQNASEQNKPFEMKVFFVRDQLQRVTNDQVGTGFIISIHKDLFWLV